MAIKEFLNKFSGLFSKEKERKKDLSYIKNLSFLLSTTVMVCLIVLTGESIVNICSTKKQNSEAFSADETEKLADASTPLKSSTEAQATLQYV